MQQDSINFLRDSLTHHRELKKSLDQKASFLSALAGVIFTISIGRLDEVQYLVLAVSSFLSALLSILVVFLPFRGKVKDRGLMCWWGFADKNIDQYKDQLNKVLFADKEVPEEYIKEIWSLANNSLKPKTKLLKWASLILIFGFLAGFVLFFV